MLRAKQALSSLERLEMERLRFGQLVLAMVRAGQLVHRAERVAMLFTEHPFSQLPRALVVEHGFGWVTHCRIRLSYRLAHRRLSEGLVFEPGTDFLRRSIERFPHLQVGVRRRIVTGLH